MTLQSNGWRKTENNMNKILQVIVGSQAHGLAEEESDVDYRGVFVQNTTNLLKLFPKTKDTIWVEGEKDSTYYEVSKFLVMAIKGVPTILEVFLAPITFINAHGEKLRSLFPYVWDSKNVRDSFINYSKNQRKKFLENKQGRASKYAINYLQALYNGFELLASGKTFSINLKPSPIYEKLKNIRNGNYSIGEVIDEGFYWKKKLENAYQENPGKKSDLKTVENFLFKLRKEYW